MPASIQCSGNDAAMAIWFQPFDLARVRQLSRNTLDEQLGIEFSAFGDDWLAATMPVDRRTVQPFGLLHGGASVALAESVGSIGANLCVDVAKYRCVGQSIYANHLRGVREGLVTGTARPVHLGRSSHVWAIEIRATAGQLVCAVQLTVAVLPHR
jgi:1,4-dihydroxy-2-naphthoyl-CoA hydrolase